MPTVPVPLSPDQAARLEQVLSAAMRDAQADPLGPRWALYRQVAAARWTGSPGVVRVSPPRLPLVEKVRSA